MHNFFLVMYHILKPYKTSLDEMITKRSTWMEMYILDPSWYFPFKSPLLCMFCVYLLIIFIFIQVSNFNIYKNWHIDDFIICLWQLNTIRFVKSPWWCKMQSILTCNYLVQLFYVFQMLWSIHFCKSDNFTMDEIILMTL
jgi:hypothetical protein